MRKKWIFTGVAFALAMTLTGCRDNAAASIPQQSSQEQTQMIPMEEAQEAALNAADIVAADADISATTLSEVAGVACYKVEFTSGEYAYAYTINAETGAVMEMSSQERLPDADQQYCHQHGSGTDLRFSLSPGTDLSRCTGTECNRYRNRG